MVSQTGIGLFSLFVPSLAFQALHLQRIYLKREHADLSFAETKHYSDTGKNILFSHLWFPFFPSLNNLLTRDSDLYENNI